MSTEVDIRRNAPQVRFQPPPNDSRPAMGNRPLPGVEASAGTPPKGSTPGVEALAGDPPWSRGFSRRPAREPRLQPETIRGSPE